MGALQGKGGDQVVGETQFFWRITEDLMVAIKKQMHWPWTQDLKDIFIGMLKCASDQTQNSRRGERLEVAQWEGSSDKMSSF